MKNKFDYLVRNIEAGDLLEKFLISAVTSILVIRTWFHLVGYLQIAKGQIHIAHMLFGGFLMMIALVAILTYLNRETRSFAAVIGGIGFGDFIDELGKFITRDNNYFFQPTIALIYVILVLLFLWYRRMEKTLYFSQREYEVNALDLMKEVVLHDLDVEERKNAIHLLSHCNPQDPMTKLLRETLAQMEALPAKKESWIVKIREIVRDYYRKLIQAKWFSKLVIWFFAISGVAGFIPNILKARAGDSFSEWGQFLSAAFSGFLVIIGIYFIRKKQRMKAYKMFQSALLVSIFLTQFFLFYKEQLSAITGLLINIVVLSVVQNLIYQEGMVEKT